jgi:hypothetical protein
VLNRPAGNVPYPDLLVFGSGCQIPTVWAEANTADIEISILVDGVILQRSNKLTGSHIVDLGRTIAAGGDVLAIRTESHAANHTVMH